MKYNVQIMCHKSAKFSSKATPLIHIWLIKKKKQAKRDFTG